MANILLIDDDEGVRDVILSTLKRAGHTVSVAVNGVEAGRSLKTETPALVITDIIMPERDGLETILALQHDKRMIPVIAMTGMWNKSSLYLKIAKDLGAVKILTKPFEMQELIAATNEVLGNSK